MVIDGKTKITLTFFVTLLGGFGWLTSMNAKVEANTKDIHVLTIQNEEKMKVLYEIKERVIRIEERQRK